MFSGNSNTKYVNLNKSLGWQIKTLNHDVKKWGREQILLDPALIMSNHAYSVMQSDGNSFGRDVVFNSIYVTLRDEDRILDQMIKSKNVLYVYLYGDILFVLYDITRKFILT